SGKRISPNAVTTLKRTPVLINTMMRILTIVVSIENLSSLQEFREGSSSDKGQDTQQQDDLQEEFRFIYQGQQSNNCHQRNSDGIQCHYTVSDCRTFNKPVKQPRKGDTDNDK